MRGDRGSRVRRHCSCSIPGVSSVKDELLEDEFVDLPGGYYPKASVFLKPAAERTKRLMKLPLIGGVMSSREGHISLQPWEARKLQCVLAQPSPARADGRHCHKSRGGSARSSSGDALFIYSFLRGAHSALTLKDGAEMMSRFI
ncbi:hypothetical protein NDU88_000503 [Pleurodeles waltl]|uniref:Uncharacterized protein n=1 Tax=Pleurodeles waltl TaxID=8319 RepID=A0AAV7TFB0_PLEWA|nr:hypothetical protein NDU88_000503 [Pleurodeles waltl]